eukprot:GHVN01032946.1.p1 GENE.GHVN01032946.1~~GHVN01032946.1.p1  ORF type:complete len:430 (-),score=92.50 GHVN01032946.1:1967-3256(-)
MSNQTSDPLISPNSSSSPTATTSLTTHLAPMSFTSSTTASPPLSHSVCGGGVSVMSATSGLSNLTGASGNSRVSRASEVGGVSAPRIRGDVSRARLNGPRMIVGDGLSDIERQESIGSRGDRGEQGERRRVIQRQASESEDEISVGCLWFNRRRSQRSPGRRLSELCEARTCPNGGEVNGVFGVKPQANAMSGLHALHASDRRVIGGEMSSLHNERGEMRLLSMYPVGSVSGGSGAKARTANEGVGCGNRVSQCNPVNAPSHIKIGVGGVGRSVKGTNSLGHVRQSVNSSVGCANGHFQSARGDGRTATTGERRENLGATGGGRGEGGTRCGSPNTTVTCISSSYTRPPRLRPTISPMSHLSGTQPSPSRTSTTSTLVSPSPKSPRGMSSTSHKVRGSGGVKGCERAASIMDPQHGDKPGNFRPSRSFH